MRDTDEEKDLRASEDAISKELAHRMDNAMCSRDHGNHTAYAIAASARAVIATLFTLEVHRIRRGK